MKTYYEPDRAGAPDPRGPRGRKHLVISAALLFILFPSIGFALAYVTMVAWRVAALVVVNAMPEFEGLVQAGPGSGGLTFLLPVALLSFILALRTANRLAARLLRQPHWWPYQGREEARRARRKRDLTTLLLGLVIIVAFEVVTYPPGVHAAAEIMIGLYVLAIAGIVVVDAVVSRLRR